MNGSHGSTPDLKQLQQTASAMLGRQPGSVVKYLLQEVLGSDSQHYGDSAAEPGIQNSKQVQLLKSEQWADGSWGAFHSENTTRKQKIPTTEFGVRRALALGLGRDHPIMQRAEAYINAVLNSEISFPDRPEKNDRWETGKRLFLASTLSLINPAHPKVDVERKIWEELTRRAFASGIYREEDDIKAHKNLTGASIRGSYLAAGSKYQLELLGAQRGCLAAEIEFALIEHLWGRPQGIGYLSESLHQLPRSTKPGVVDRWMASLELLAFSFPTWVNFAGKAVEWLWNQRQADGLWDFRAKPVRSIHLPYSDSWRSQLNRRIDWSTRCLVLLEQYLQDCGG